MEKNKLSFQLNVEDFIPASNEEESFKFSIKIKSRRLSSSY